MNITDSGFKCDVCDKSFSRKETYNNHNLWHTGRTLKILVVFNYKNQQRFFLESPHTCSMCGKSFTRRIILEKHEKKHSLPAAAAEPKTIKAMLSCDYCHKKFTRNAYLKAHLAIHTQGA